MAPKPNKTVVKLSIFKDDHVEFDDCGYLASGVHEVSLEEIEEHFCFSPKRKKLFEGLKRMLVDLKDVGCEKFYLDGSFATNKLEPGDFDGCWEKNRDIDWDRIDKQYPELKMISPPREEQMKKYLGEALLSDLIFMDDPANPVSVLEFFQKDKDGRGKGILLIKL